MYACAFSHKMFTDFFSFFEKHYMLIVENLGKNEKNHKAEREKSPNSNKKDGYYSHFGVFTLFCFNELLLKVW